MSKAAIRRTKYAKAIRTGIMIGRKEAAEFGQHATSYRTLGLINDAGYSVFYDTNLFEIVWNVASKVYDHDLIKHIHDTWSEEEYVARCERVRFLNMSNKEREDYLLREEVKQLRETVETWNRIVGMDSLQK